MCMCGYDKLQPFNLSNLFAEQYSVILSVQLLNCMVAKLATYSTNVLVFKVFQVL